MGDQTSNTTNLDLNLRPDRGPENSYEFDEMENIDPVIGETDIFHDLVPRRSRRWRWLPVQVPTIESSANLNFRDGSVRDETIEGRKTCEINNSSVEDEKTERKADSMKTDCDDGSFFDCNICLDLAKEPIVTSCGHLFCWSCLYHWLHYHSGANDCPVCKGEVTIKNLTPIYGRGRDDRAIEEDVDFKIPRRPQARKVESLREVIHRNGNSFPFGNIARHLGNRSDLTRDLVHQRESENFSETFGRALNRIMTSRGRRRQIQDAFRPENEVDLTHGEGVFGRENTPRLYRFSPAGSPFLDLHLIDRNPEHPTSVENVNEPFSSVIGVVDSEDQIDSRGLLSRNDVSSILDDDGRDSRRVRRRRLDGEASMFEFV